MDDDKRIAVLDWLIEGPQRGQIDWVWALPEYRRQGLATKLLEFARTKVDYLIFHSEDLSDEGRAWRETVGVLHIAGPGEGVIPERVKHRGPINIRAPRTVVIDPMAQRDMRRLEPHERNAAVKIIKLLEQGKAPLEAKERELAGTYGIKLDADARLLIYPHVDGAWHVYYMGDHDYGEATRRMSAPRAAHLAAEDYRGRHQPSKAAPLYDLLEGDMLPEDMYVHPKWYTGFPGPATLGETLRTLNGARGKPNVMVTIYRSAPPGVNTINEGDWVSLSKQYARQHGLSNGDDDWPVYSAQVPARTVWHAGDDLMEWGYWGPAVHAGLVKTATVTITMYHGTLAANVEAIKREGLRPPPGVMESRWPMLTTSREQAARYMGGRPGAVVLEYRVPADKVWASGSSDAVLWPAETHGVYGFEAMAYGIKGSLPSTYLVAVHPIK